MTPLYTALYFVFGLAAVASGVFVLALLAIGAFTGESSAFFLMISGIALGFLATFAALWAARKANNRWPY